MLGKAATSSISGDDSKEIISTSGQRVISSRSSNNDYLQPCNHEEADTRIVLHLSDAVQRGHSDIIICTADTDVVVLVVSNFHKIGAQNIWLSFGVAKHHRYIAAHEIASELGPRRAMCLPMFHSFTGCDVTSFFCGKGKKSAWGNLECISYSD